MQKQFQQEADIYREVLVDPNQRVNHLEQFIQRRMQPLHKRATFMIMTESKNKYFQIEQQLDSTPIDEQKVTNSLINLIGKLTESVAIRINPLYSQVAMSLTSLKFSRALMLNLSNCRLNSIEFVALMDCPLIENLILDLNCLSSLKGLAKTNFSHLQTLSLKKNPVSDLSPLPRTRTNPCQSLPPLFVQYGGGRIFRAENYHYFTLYFNCQFDKGYKQNTLVLFKMEPQRYKRVQNTSRTTVIKLKKINDKVKHRSPLVTVNERPIYPQRGGNSAMRLMRMQRSINNTIWSQQLYKNPFEVRSEQEFLNQQNH